MRLGQDVAVQHVVRVHRPRSLLGGVQLQEGVGVPDGQQRLTHTLTDALFGDDQVAAAQNRRGHEEPAHGVRAVAVEDLHHVRVVALGLGHLLPVRTQHDAVRDHLLIRHAVKQRGGQHVLHVEPAAGLAGVFHDEVRRLAGLKLLAVVKRVVVLGERHGTGLEPAVEHVRHAAHHGRTGRVVRVGADQLVDVRAVQRLRAGAKVALQLVQGAVDVHTRVLRVVGDPRRHRGAPVAGAGNVPVARTLEPLAKLAVADVLRDPLDLLVQLHHAVADIRHLHKPRGQGHVDQRLAGAPRVRVGVHDGLVADHPALRAQVADDVAVGVEDQLAFVLGHERGELAVRIHGDDKVDAVLLAGEHIVLTERRRLVDDAGAVLGGHVIRVEDHKRVVVVAEVVEDRLVLQALQLRAHVRGHNVVVAELLAVRAEQARC